MKRTRFQTIIRTLPLAAALFIIPAYNSPVLAHNKSPADIQNHSAENLVNADLEKVRKRIVDDLMAPPVNEEKIGQLVESITPGGSWPGINYEDTTRTGFQHSIHLENMLNLARAYKKSGTRYYLSPAVKKTVSSALDFWIAHDFICENWWWNEMGTPNWMVNTLLILDTDLTERQRTEGLRIAGRANFTGVGARAGGDFVPIAGMVCKQALFKRDEAMLNNAIRVMTDQIVITERRGINPDMGFHHRLDNVTSIHTYGTSYVSSFAYWAVKFAQTEFNMPEDALTLLIDYYLDGICKAMAFGIYADPGAQNRDLSRKNAVHAAGAELPENLLTASDHRKNELKYIIDIRTGKRLPELVWDKYFWHSGYFAHQSKTYFASARMYSSRQNNVEEPYNEESLKMHHLADGANFISRTGKEYVNVFPVWDWQKIPGATIVQKPSLPSPKQIAKKGLTDFVGGVTNGEFGVAAFDFKSVHDPLTARKGWFFFDKEYVCLGAEIRSESGYPVVTTLNQSLLKTGVRINAQNKTQSLKKGQHHLNNVSWVCQDSIGYLFPTPANIHVSNATATGQWKDITHQAWADKEPVVKKDLFTLWIDHGQKPTNAKYEYIVIPGTDAKGLKNYDGAKKITILSNDGMMQAVQHTGLNLTGIIFYEAGTLETPQGLTIQAENPCIMLVKNNGKTIQQVSVSDPTHKLASVSFSVNTRVEKQADNWQSSWQSEKGISSIKVDLPKDGFAGQSVTCAL